MSEAAGPKLWGFNQAPSVLAAAYGCRSVTTESDSGDPAGGVLKEDRIWMDAHKGRDFDFAVRGHTSVPPLG
ncbi:MAG TPA: hypothetical protein VLK23_20160 [Thermodesulfobacteriota bacterium]|nr:hypothetical protein [Thermodesulfobacteriota bacterium]